VIVKNKGYNNETWGLLQICYLHPHQETTK